MSIKTITEVPNEQTEEEKNQIVLDYENAIKAYLLEIQKDVTN